MIDDAPAIEIANLVRTFGPTEAVDGLSLRVAPGRCYGFFGRNGAGKTTTIKCLLNLLRPTSGVASSLCTSAVRAVVTAVVVGALALRLILVPSLWLGRERGFIVLLSAVVLLLVRFASLNHRQEPPSAVRVGRQALSLALVALVGIAVLVVSGR